MRQTSSGQTIVPQSTLFGRTLFKVRWEETHSGNFKLNKYFAAILGPVNYRKIERRLLESIYGFKQKVIKMKHSNLHSIQTTSLLFPQFYDFTFINSVLQLES